MSKSGIPIVSDVAKVAGKVIQPVAKAIRPIAPILPFIPIPGMFGLSSLLTRSLLTGALGGFDKQGKFDVGRGVKSGLLAYGIGSLMNPATAASGTPGISGFADAADEVGGALSGGISSGMPISAPDISVTPISAAPDISTMPVSNTMTAAQMDPSILRNLPAEATTAGPVSTAGPTAIKAAISEPTAADVINKALEPSYLDKLGNYVSSLPGKAVEYVSDPKNLIPTTLSATTAYGAISSKQELDRQKEEADRILRNREREKAEDVAQAESFLRDYPLLYKQFTAEDVQRMGLASGGIASYDDQPGMDYAMGGLASLAGGGMPPRYLRGGGDGMSDSIPARIGDKQEARLADGEFVVPADVVSHIGNGSSNAGAKKLYAMMDRVRQARTGKTRQAPAVNMRRMMPV